MSTPTTPFARRVCLLGVAATLLSFVFGGCPADSVELPPPNPAASPQDSDWDGIPPSTDTTPSTEAYEGPRAFSGVYATQLGTPVTVELVGQTYPGVHLDFAILSPPQNGTLGPITPTATNVAEVVYTPAPNFMGDDAFTFQVHDGETASNVATVSIVVGTPVYFALDVYEGTPPLTVTATAFPFDGLELPEGQYAWDFGDGTRLVGPVSTHDSVTHTYRRAGRFAVTLGLTLSGLAAPIPSIHTGIVDEPHKRSDDPTVAYVSVDVTIRGRVLDESGVGVPQIQITGDNLPAPAETDASGNFTVRVPPGWSGSLTPVSLTGQYAFSPPQRPYTNVTADIIGADFTALAGVPMADAGPDQTVVDVNNSGCVNVTLDGSSSYDPDGLIANYEWRAGSNVLYTGPQPQTTTCLPVGTHDFTLTVTDNENNTGSDTTRVVVKSGALLSVSPATAFTIEGTAGGPFEPLPTKTYTLRNDGGVALTWTVQHDASWLSVSPKSTGTLDPNQAIAVTIALDTTEAASLPAGTHTATLQFVNNTNSAGNTTRGVSLNLQAVTPQIRAIADHSWTPGVLYARTPSLSAGSPPITWSLVTKPAGMTINSTTGTITWADPQPAGSQHTITVRAANTAGSDDETWVLTLQGSPGALEVTPATDFTSSGYVGGPFSPPSAEYTLANTGGQAISWSAASSQNWVTVSPTGGTLDPGDTVALTATLNGNAEDLLAQAAAYTGTVTITNTTNGVGNATRGVSLVVKDPPTLTVSPDDGLSSAGDQGGPFSPTSKTYTLTNTGDDPLNYTVAKTQPWVALSRTSGTLTAGATVQVTVSLNDAANGLNGSTFSDLVTFTNTTNNRGNASRSVSLLVHPTGVQPMTAASRTSGVMPLGVFFDCVDDSNEPWLSGVVQPRGFGDHPTNITGVRITRVEYGTPLGNGTLTYSAAHQTLQWRAAGESYGLAVNVAAGRTFALPSSGGRNLHVWVFPDELPAGSASDTIAIVSGGLNADWASFHYEWDFGDPAPAGTSPTDPRWYWEHGAKKSDGSWFEKNKAFGWNAAHVYEAAGSYTVTLRIIDDVDNEYTYQQTVNVQAEPEGGWITYHFAANGNDDNPGTLAAPKKTWAHACTLAGDRVRLRFRRGDTFQALQQMAPNVPNGPFQIDSYGAGERPTFAIVGTNAFYYGGNEPGVTRDVRLIDIRIEGAYPAQVSPGMATVRLSETLALRVRIANMSHGFHTSGRARCLVQDCEAINSEKYNYWISWSPKTAVLGSISSKGNTEALMRTYTNKLIVQHSTFEEPSGKYSIRFVSEHQFGSGCWTIAAYNLMNETVFSVHNDGIPLRVPYHCVIEGNRFEHRTKSGADAIEVYACEWLTVRNNVVCADLKIKFAKFFNGYSNADYQYTIRNLRLINNTMYTATDTWVAFVYSVADPNLVSAVYAQNNALSAPASINDASLTRVLWDTAFFDARTRADNNCWHVPQVPKPFRHESTALTFSEWKALGEWDLLSTSADPLFASPTTSDLRIQPSSPCVSAGSDQVLPWCRTDADGVPRARGAVSMGALEP